MKRRRFDEATPAATETLSLPRREPLCLSLSLFLSVSIDHRSNGHREIVGPFRPAGPGNGSALLFPLDFSFYFFFLRLSVFRFAGGGGWGVPFGPAPSAL